MKCDFCKEKPKMKKVIFRKKKLEVCTMCKAVLFAQNKKEEDAADEHTPHGFGKC
jgi:hypothetical protein